MAQVLPGSHDERGGPSRFTATVRRRLDSSQALRRQLDDVPEVAQGTKTAKAQIRSKEPRSAVLSTGEEAVIVAFRRHPLMPLNDCLYGFWPTISQIPQRGLYRRLDKVSKAACARLASEASRMDRLRLLVPLARSRAVRDTVQSHSG